MQHFEIVSLKCNKMFENITYHQHKQIFTITLIRHNITIEKNRIANNNILQRIKIQWYFSKFLQVSKAAALNSFLKFINQLHTVSANQHPYNFYSERPC